MSFVSGFMRENMNTSAMYADASATSNSTAYTVRSRVLTAPAATVASNARNQMNAFLPRQSTRAMALY